MERLEWVYKGLGEEKRSFGLCTAQNVLQVLAYLNGGFVSAAIPCDTGSKHVIDAKYVIDAMPLPPRSVRNDLRSAALLQISSPKPKTSSPKSSALSPKP